MARRLALLPLVAAILLFGCKKGGPPALATAAATPTPAVEPATGGAAQLPGENAGVPAAPGAVPGAVPGAAPGTATAPGMPPGALPSQAAALDVGKLPSVVAKVNGAPISKQELLQRAAAMRDQMARMGGPPPPATGEFYHAMLDQLIGSRLLIAEAKAKGYAPTPAEVNEQIAHIRSNFPDEATFKKQLAAQGASEEQLRNEIGQNLAIQKLVAAQITPNVKVTEQAARAFYQQNQAKMQRPPQVRVRHLLVAVPQNATPEQKQAAQKKAQDLLARIQKGEDFATLARQSSDDPGSKNDGGLLPWMGQGETVPPFEKAAFDLKPGQTSGVVETPFGFHILRLEDKRPASTVPFEEARPKIEEMLARREARDMLEQKVQSLRQAAKVEVLF